MIRNYPCSGEVNSEVADVQSTVLAKVEEHYCSQDLREDRPDRWPRHRVSDLAVQIFEAATPEPVIQA